MIAKIKQAIVYTLIESFPMITTRYTDDNIPQNFSKPSFFTSVIDQDYEKRLNIKNKGLLSFDVAYFSAEEISKIKSDCLVKQEDLLREFDLIGTVNKFRVLNKNARITDNVLHMTFDVNYSELKVESKIPMRTQETNTNI